MKKIKIITILSLIFLIITITTNSYALTTIISDSDQFLGKGSSVEQTLGAEGNEQLKNTSNDLFKLLTAIGIVVMFIVGTIIGIQFMIASAEDKAKVKEALVPYIVGCIIIFGAFTIWSIVVKTGQTLFPTTKTSAPKTDIPDDLSDYESDSEHDVLSGKF